LDDAASSEGAGSGRGAAGGRVGGAAAAAAARETKETRDGWEREFLLEREARRVEDARRATVEEERMRLQELASRGGEL